MIRVVCVGDVMVDVLARLPGPLAPGSDTPAPVAVHGGGAAANVAVWLAASGATATLVGRVGDDDLGRQAVAALRGAGVETVLSADPDRPTGMCVVLVDPSGERTMVPSAGANAGLSAVAAQVLPARADWLYVSGYTLLGEGSRPFALAALAVARERGWQVAVDAASAAPLTAAGPFLDWIGRDLLLFANADEARVLTGLDDPGAAARALALRCGTAIVKSGGAGAVWSDGTSARSVPAVAATVVDSTGAGDAFTAGFLGCDGDVGQRLRAAAGLAARAVTRVGARPG